VTEYSTAKLYFAFATEFQLALQQAALFISMKKNKNGNDKSMYIVTYYHHSNTIQKDSPAPWSTKYFRAFSTWLKHAAKARLHTNFKNK
jgi:hypothetical protein